MRKLILIPALMLATSATAGTVPCDPTAAFHPMVTDGNGTVYEASYFNNPTCAAGETESRIANLGVDPMDDDPWDKDDIEGDDPALQ